MRKLLITLDDDLDLWLEGKPNQNETVRKALYVYKGDITTDGVEGIRESYKVLKQTLDEKFEYYDHMFSQLEKLINMLETRM